MRHPVNPPCSQLPIQATSVRILSLLTFPIFARRFRTLQIATTRFHAQKYRMASKDAAGAADSTSYDDFAVVSEPSLQAGASAELDASTRGVAETSHESIPDEIPFDGNHLLEIIGTGQVEAVSAALQRSQAWVSQLVRFGGDSWRDPTRPLAIAASAPEAAAFEIALMMQPIMSNFPEQAAAAMVCAVRAENWDLVRFLAQHVKDAEPSIAQEACSESIDSFMYHVSTELDSGVDERTSSKGSSGTVDLLKALLTACTWTKKQLVKLLIVALRSGLATFVEVLVAEGADLTFTDSWGRSALHLGALSARLAMVRWLLQQPHFQSASAVNAQSRHGETPLYSALQSSFSSGAQNRDVVAVCKELLEAGADAKILAARGLSMLHVAASHRQKAAIPLLVSHGADPNCQDLDTRSALAYATLHSNPESGEVVEELLRVGVDPALGSMCPLVFTVDTGTQTRFMANTSAKEFRVLSRAWKNEHEQPSPMQLTNWPPLLDAIASGNAFAAAPLLKVAPLVTNRCGVGALHVAALYNQLELAEACITAGVSVNGSAETMAPPPLHWAVEGQHIEMGRFLLRSGADCLGLSQRLCTPLHVAAAVGNVEICTELLRACPQALGAHDIQGQTPLHYAARAGVGGAVDSLLTAGASLVAMDASGRRPCDCAATSDLKAELTPLPPRISSSALLPATGTWCITQWIPGAPGPPAAAVFSSAKDALRAVAALPEGVQAAAAFSASIQLDGHASAVGAGGFGDVSLKVLKRSGLPCAVKALRVASGTHALAAQRELAYEIRVQSSIIAPATLARVLGVVQSAPVAGEAAGGLSAVAEFVPGCQWTWVTEELGQQLPCRAKLGLALSLLEAIMNLHSQSVAHRDVHSGNVMVEINPAGALRARLVDFGLSYPWSLRADGYAATVLQKLHLGLSPPQGSAFVVKYARHTKEWQQLVDLFGAACLLTWLGATGAPPFSGWIPQHGSFAHSLHPFWIEGAPFMQTQLGQAVRLLLEACGVTVKPSSVVNASQTAPEPAEDQAEYGDFAVEAPHIDAGQIDTVTALARAMEQLEVAE